MAAHALSNTGESNLMAKTLEEKIPRATSLSTPTEPSIGKLRRSSMSYFIRHVLGLHIPTTHETVLKRLSSETSKRT